MSLLYHPKWAMNKEHGKLGLDPVRVYARVLHCHGGDPCKMLLFSHPGDC